jgi:hypothetical protein
MAVFGLFTVAVLVGGGTVHAQGVTTGAITGRVTTTDGATLAGAVVTVTHVETGYTARSVTRPNGMFLVQGLEVGGPYTVTFRAIGYEPITREGIYVRLSQATRVDVEMAPRAVVLEELTVTVARTADFTPTRQGVGTNVSDTLVQRVPTFSRDFVDLLKLSPQVVYPGSGAPSGGGMYNRFNTITIDGANQSERFNLGSTQGVPGGSASGKLIGLDAVKEFRVTFTPSDVRQGNFAGMLVNAVTKSGTNTFTGGALFTYRSNQDVLGLNLVGREFRDSEFKVRQYGFHLGGPILKDRLHFFIAPEWQRRAVPAAGPYYLGDSAVGTPVVPLSELNRIANIMRTTYGFEVGETGPVDNENPLLNLFGRLDFQVSENHRLVFRQLINHADQDEFSRNVQTYNPSPLVQNAGFRFSSNRFSRVNRNTSSVAQLYSNFSGGRSNELIVGYNTIKDERFVPVRAPEVTVGVNVGGTVRAVTFGTEQFSPNNRLEQDIFEVVNNFTMPVGSHTLTFGGRFDYTKIFNNFAQGSYGVYKFPTIEALQAGTPAGYAVGYANSQNDKDIPANFRVLVFSLYGQDQWAVNDRFTVTAGLRADIPHFMDRPSQNDDMTAALAAVGLPGVRTDFKPKTRPLFSPRLGFNYDPTGELRNQVRGSIGIYTGPPPYILLGNAYANTGLGLVRLSCTGTAVPAFTMDVSQLPRACAGQQPPAPNAAGTVGINTTDPDFKFPQYFGTSFGFDRQLPFNTVLTVEAMYRKAINGVLIRDANIKGPRLVGGAPYTDRHGRVLYADTIVASGAVTNDNQRYLRTYKGVSFTEGIIEVTNQSRDYNASVSAQLNRRFSNRFEATVAYTHTVSKDVQSLTSDRAISNWRNGRQLSTHGHEDLTLTTSVFSRPHRFLAYGTYTLPWGLTDVTLYYEGTSGVPFSYTALGDLNGDGFNGNDLIYVPKNALDPNEIRIGTGVGASFVQNVRAAQAFEKFIEAQPCLDRQRGRIMERNSCRSPFQHRLDLSVRQSLPTIRGQKLAVQLDFFNFLNFIDSDWGKIRLPTLSPFFPDQRALVQTGRNPGPLNQSLPTFTFDTRLWQSDPTKAAYQRPLPFQSRTGSVYQVQLTVRYAF